MGGESEGKGGQTSAYAGSEVRDQRSVVKSEERFLAAGFLLDAEVIVGES